MDRIHVKLENEEKCWFTSDQHFNHSNVLLFCNRPWSDVISMNNGITDNWNNVVGDNDVVFTLGDFYWHKDLVSIVKKIKQLKGKTIYILPGNHDDVEIFKKIKDKRVRIISDVSMIFISGIDEDKPAHEHEFVISHFPLATWPHFRRGVINLHGHIHSGPRTNNEVDIPGYDLILKPKLTYDVGVDNNDYTPIEIRDIMKNLNKM